MQIQDGASASLHAFDSADYDPVDHLNAIFSHPSTLSSATAVSTKLDSHCHDLDVSIDKLSVERAASDVASLDRMRQAQAELSTLFQKIDRLRERALQTETMITEMTADIKRLDGTKKNLTLSMTALKRLQMLTTAYEQLRGLGKSRQYRECASLLAAVIQLMAHFKSYRSIDQIATLARKVAELQRELLEQVCEDFEEAFNKNEVQKQRGTLAEGCLVMDALGENAKARLVTWYCNTTLREYRNIFRGSDEAGSLDNISRRYAWFSRLLKTYDGEHAAVFPAHWRVNELLANAFCQSTREDFKTILQRSARREDGKTLDVSLLLSCLQETLDFEHGLEKRFAAEARRSTDTTSSADERPRAFEQAISEAFEPYLSLWVEAQDRALAGLMPQYRAAPMRADDEDFHAQLVLPSSGELFGVYRTSLAQCAKLSTGSRLLELARTFGKYLDAYAQQVLFHHLAGGGGSGGSICSPSLEETIILLNTADYCYTTATQLEDKIKTRIDAELRAQVDLSAQADTFMGIASAAVRQLARRIDSAAEPAWRELRATAWARLEHVADRSAYMPELVGAIQASASATLALLQHKPQYARALCDATADALAASFTANVAAAKPVGEVGAEQLLLDLHALRAAVLELPALASGHASASATTTSSAAAEGITLANTATATPSSTPAAIPASYTRRVTATLARPEPLLKTLQVRPAPPEALVQAYLVHIADASDANFRTVLDIKGLARRQDQAPLLALFAAHRAASPDALAPSNPLVAGLQAAGAPGVAAVPGLSAGAGAGAGAGAATPAGSLGAALFGAAAGMPAGPGPGPGPSSSSGPASRVASPPLVGGGEANAGAGANLNENLRSLGKFFKRDFGRGRT